MSVSKGSNPLYTEDVQKLFPREHLPVLRLLLNQLVEATLLLPLKYIENNEAMKIKRILEERLGKSLSEKVIREMVNAAAVGQSNIRKPRPGTLNLLAKFVLGKYELNNAAKEAMDNHNYWDIFLEKNEHLISLHVINGMAARQNNHVAELILADTIESTNGNRLKPSILPVNNRPDFDHDNQKMHSRKLLESGLAAGFILGLVNTLIVIVSPQLLNGYSNISGNDLMKLIPRITFSNVLGGMCFGLLLSYFGIPSKEKRTRFGLAIGQTVAISIIILLLLVIFKQSAARSAFTSRGILEGSDFETVAYFFSLLTGIILLLGAIRKNYHMNLSQILENTILIVLKSTLPLFLVFFFYQRIIAKSAYDLKSFPTNHLEIFIFQYSHPERILLIIAMAFSSVFIFLSVRNFYLRSIHHDS
jgi:hypothetical protein